MGIEVVILIVLAAAFIIMKVIQGDSERKRRIERSERLLRDKAATGGFSQRKQWDDFAEEHESYLEPESVKNVEPDGDSESVDDSSFKENPYEKAEEKPPSAESK
ncbi:MAG: hypothetical protein HN727_16205 [Opitutae bacterium]|nr:hypothetical protein [Opitutae bacterium]